MPAMSPPWLSISSIPYLLLLLLLLTLPPPTHGSSHENEIHHKHQAVLFSDHSTSRGQNQVVRFGMQDYSAGAGIYGNVPQGGQVVAHGEGAGEEEEHYEGETEGKERLLGKRKAEAVLNSLQNGKARNLNIQYGEIQHWVLPSTELFADTNTNNRLRRRSDDEDEEGAEEGEPELDDHDEQGTKNLRKRQKKSRKVYISFNTCLQPVFNSSLPLEAPLLQLELYASNSTSNKSPGPTVRNSIQYAIAVDGGFGMIALDATTDVYVGVYAPDLETSDQAKYTGPWNYEIAISTSEPLHGAQSKQNMYLVDSDNWSALLITGNLTASNATQDEIDKVMNSPPPYVMYAQNTNYTSPFRGLERSYCAVSKLAQVRLANLDTSLTRRGIGNLPKQQFYIQGLNRSSMYLGYLAKPNLDTTAGGGGSIWEEVRITTKSDGNCQIVYDLPFCSEVAYAVPANPTIFESSTQLGKFYDDIAHKWYSNFSYSLEQVACDANARDRTMQYSFARSCDDCADAYKTWLCAVTIPRCADFTSNQDFLAERGLWTEFFNQTANATVPNSPDIGFHSRGNDSVTAASLKSRNPAIEEVVRPGPYKEIKPCMDLCYTLVQSCPSSFGFACPRMGSWGKEVSYGERSPDGDVTCSWLGAAYFLSAAERASQSGMRARVALVMAVLWAGRWAWDGW